MATYDKKCNFAPLGTYGHECGKDATHAVVMQSDLTVSGIYYGARCPECLDIKGGENTRIHWIMPIDPETQVNRWK